MAVFRKCGTCATNADMYRGLMEAIITKDIQQRFKIRNTDALRKKSIHVCSAIEWLLKME